MFTPRNQNPALAAVLILAATAFIALTTLLAKALGTGSLGDLTLGPPLPALQISHGRFVFALLAIGTVAAMMRPRFTRVHWGLHLGRTTLGWLGVTLMFAAVAFIPMAEATAISFLSPVFCMIFAIPLLGERVGPVRWSAAVIALLGATILLRPTPAGFQPAALLALAAALAMGMELILIKRLAGRERPLQILLINNVIGTVIATIAVIPVWQSPQPAQWVALAGIGFGMAAAQACFVNGMARADASFVAPVSYATLVFAGLWDALVFGILPDAVGLIGAVVILSGAVLLAWREARVTRFVAPGGHLPPGGPGIRR
jgi:drug/metabolite transporter (DMT)-like permease